MPGARAWPAACEQSREDTCGRVGGTNGGARQGTRTLQVRKPASQSTTRSVDSHGSAASTAITRVLYSTVQGGAILNWAAGARFVSGECRATRGLPVLTDPRLAPGLHLQSKWRVCLAFASPFPGLCHASTGPPIFDMSTQASVVTVGVPRHVQPQKHVLALTVPTRPAPPGRVGRPGGGAASDAAPPLFSCQEHPPPPPKRPLRHAMRGRSLCAAGNAHASGGGAFDLALHQQKKTAPAEEVCLRACIQRLDLIVHHLSAGHGGHESLSALPVSRRRSRTAFAPPYRGLMYNVKGWTAAHHVTRLICRAAAC